MIFLSGYFIILFLDSTEELFQIIWGVDLVLVYLLSIGRVQVFIELVRLCTLKIGGERWHFVFSWEELFASRVIVRRMGSCHRLKYLVAKLVFYSYIIRHRIIWTLEFGTNRIMLIVVIASLSKRALTPRLNSIALGNIHAMFKAKPNVFDSFVFDEEELGLS